MRWCLFKEKQMKVMTRIIFDRNEPCGWGINALQDWGYTVLARESDDEFDYILVEAVHDVSNPDTPVGMEWHELVVVQKIVTPYGGLVNDTGPLPAGHIPFNYGTAAWRAQRRILRRFPQGVREELRKAEEGFSCAQMKIPSKAITSRCHS
jgi:hypothetical protein